MPLKDYIKAVGVPGLVSAICLLFVWIAIISLLQGQIKLSVLCAVAAFFFDSLDGWVARRMNKAGELGRQLDSMIDLINYSLYSALLVHQELLPGWMGVIVGFVIILFGILRLIRFNLTGYTEVNSTRYYNGIVTCHLSLASIGFLLASTQFNIPPIFIATTLFTLAILQLSNIKTRKSGVLPFWYGIIIMIIIGALLWLP